jgi:hypothetical protein
LDMEEEPVPLREKLEEEVEEGDLDPRRLIVTGREKDTVDITVKVWVCMVTEGMVEAVWLGEEEEDMEGDREGLADWDDVISREEDTDGRELRDAEAEVEGDTEFKGEGEPVKLMDTEGDNEAEWEGDVEVE